MRRHKHDLQPWNGRESKSRKDLSMGMPGADEDESLLHFDARSNKRASDAEGCDATSVRTSLQPWDATRADFASQTSRRMKRFDVSATARAATQHAELGAMWMVERYGVACLGQRVAQLKLLVVGQKGAGKH